MTEINKDAIKSFYSANINDKRGIRFFRATSENQPKIIDKKSPLFYLAIAKYYNNNNVMSDNDIHYEFIDFIIELALYHRSMSGILFNMINEYINDLYYKIKGTKSNIPQFNFALNNVNVKKILNIIDIESANFAGPKSDDYIEYKNNILGKINTFNELNFPNDINTNFYYRFYNKLPKSFELNKFVKIFAKMKVNNEDIYILVPDYVKYSAYLSSFIIKNVGNIWYTDETGKIMVLMKDNIDLGKLYLDIIEYKFFPNISYHEYRKFTGDKLSFDINFNDALNALAQEYTSPTRSLPGYVPSSQPPKPVTKIFPAQLTTKTILNNLIITKPTINFTPRPPINIFTPINAQQVINP